MGKMSRVVRICEECGYGSDYLIRAHETLPSTLCPKCEAQVFYILDSSYKECSSIGGRIASLLVDFYDKEDIDVRP